MRRSTTTDKVKLFVRNKKVTNAKRKKGVRVRTANVNALKKQSQLKFKGLDKPAGNVRGYQDGYCETVAGQEYEIGFLTGKLSPDITGTNLLLWDENARYSQLMDALDGSDTESNGAANGSKLRTQTEIFNMMATRPDVKKLKEAMKINGGPCLGEPPIGVPNGGGKIEIIEGNERVVAAILNHVENPEFFAEIPIKVYKGLDRSHALLVLAALHGNGKSPWGGKEKARLHLNAIQESGFNGGLSLNDYAKFQRLNPTRLKIDIAAYLANQKYQELYEGGKPKLFSYFTKLFSKPRYRIELGMQSTVEGKGRRKRGEAFDPFKGMNHPFLKEFMRWLALNKLTDCTHVDALGLVLDHPIAGKKFREEDDCKFTEAWNIYVASNPEYGSPLHSAIYDLSEQLRDISDEEIVELSKKKGTKAARFRELRKIMDTIAERTGA